MVWQQTHTVCLCLLVSPEKVVFHWLAGCHEKDERPSIWRRDGLTTDNTASIVSAVSVSLHRCVERTTCLCVCVSDISGPGGLAHQRGV